MKSLPRVAPLLAAFALSLSACNCVDPRTPGWSACDGNGACPGGSVCCNGICFAGPSCAAMGPCDAGIRCNGACVDSESDDLNCGTCGHSCGSDEACAAGTCHTQTCTGTTCASTQVCIDNVCVARSCVGVTCGSGQTCLEGACLDRACGNTTCAVGEACFEGSCVDATCVGVTCSGTNTCVAGQCVNTAQCSDQSQNGMETDIDCGGGACTACADTLHCALPRDCLSGNCASGTCAAACVNGSPCATNGGAPCKLGKMDCVAGACVDDTDAPDGTPCASGSLCAAGVCAQCTEHASCATNPDPCKLGEQSCSVVASCIDTVNSRPVGASCGAGMVCSSTGVCSACSSGSSCTTNPGGACRAGVISCTTGAPVCVDGPNTPNGTTCGVNQVCNTGVCVGCNANGVCASNPLNPCRIGRIACGPLQSCDDGANALAGTPCNNGVCNGNGQCVACSAGSPCDTNPGAPCKVGTTDCSTGVPICADAFNATLGSDCDGGVCTGTGICMACTQGTACTTNPLQCKTGITSCATGISRCVDNTPKNAGVPCGDGGVTCDGNGYCGACGGGAACLSATLCKRGNTACTDGGVTFCNATINLDAGVRCGNDKVCTGTGDCIDCVADTLCSSNSLPACAIGKTSCNTGSSLCVVGSFKPAGSVCGVGSVCQTDGGCQTCTEGIGCTSNPDPCKVGITSCQSGTSVCVDTATPRSVGSSCSADGGSVCAPPLDGGSSLTCNPCAGGLACNTNSNRCYTGKTACDTGYQRCSDNTVRDAGSNCTSDGGVASVCNSLGVCGACAAGQSCSSNPNSCKLGSISCTTGTPQCLNSTVNTDAGTNGMYCPMATSVCNGDGGCVGCVPNAPCTGNSSVCRKGLTVCSSGAPVCIDGTPKDAGVACDAGLTCDGTGYCGACVPGNPCTPTNPCHRGVTSCSNGGTTCNDTGMQVDAGTTCGPSQVCTPGGACLTCTSTPCTVQGDCHRGVTNCSTGVSVCVLGPGLVGAGTTCGPNKVCSADGICAPCTAGGVCPYNMAGSCRLGRYSCQYGYQTCEMSTDAGFADAGTTCGTNYVCASDGGCNACTAGGSCSNALTPCLTGHYSCSSGSQVCVNDGQLPTGSSCGTNLVCNGSGQCVCNTGAACSVPGLPCKNGIVTCPGNVATCSPTTNKAIGTACNHGYFCDGSGQCSNLSCPNNCIDRTSGACAGPTQLDCGHNGEMCYSCPCGACFVDGSGCGGGSGCL